MTMLVTAGGRITCLQCNAKSKRTGNQCGAAAMRGKTKCAVHGGKSTGPRTAEGRKRCAEARTTNGWETRKIREERSEGLARIAALEALGRSIGMFTGPRLLGRPPKQR